MSTKFYDSIKAASAALKPISALNFVSDRVKSSSVMKRFGQKKQDIQERLLMQIWNSSPVQKFVTHMTTITSGIGSTPNRTESVESTPIQTDASINDPSLLQATISAEAERAAPTKDRLPKPFVKWAGGKGQLVLELVSRMPNFEGTYFEPFVGGGALFFYLNPQKAVIQDSNEELIHCFKIVRDRTDELINALLQLKYSNEDYYRIRAEDPDTLDPVYRAARTVYLNRTGFNGLYRVNKSGKFNVPMGRYKNPTICDEKNLKACAVALVHADIVAESFETVVSRAKKGDFVYFDPPYVPVSKTANFTAYQGGGFLEDDQKRLALVFKTLTDNGVFAMLSNADVPWTREAYKQFRIHSVQATRRVNSNAKARGPVGELIVTNY
jgi:DNA adenine methylase